MNRKTGKQHTPLTILGWREWLSLPDLKVVRIKAKLDSGAKTSALHAFNVEYFEKKGKPKVRFQIHPIQYNDKQAVNCVADVIDRRYVMSTSGHRELRYVIKTPVQLGKEIFFIELTLTDRDAMRFRMLLGRDALKGKYLLDCSKSYCLGEK